MFAEQVELPTVVVTFWRNAALRLVRPLAEQGDGRAQAVLGMYYQNGYGAPQDYAAALNWYRKAADQGLAPAQHALGHMYDAGMVSLRTKVRH